MADKAMIKHLMSEAAMVTVRRYPEAEIRQITEMLHRHFRSTSTKDFEAAFDAWFGTPTQKRALPSPGEVWSQIAKLRAAKPIPPNPAGKPIIRDEFRRAHVAFAAGTRNGFGIDADGARVGREIIAEQLAQLPPPADPAPRPCECDGSGWIDTKATADALLSAYAPVEPRVCYPCRRCSEALFWSEEWNSYFGRAEGDRKADTASD
jgi:hypothetical protein